MGAKLSGRSRCLQGPLQVYSSVLYQTMLDRVAGLTSSREFTPDPIQQSIYSVSRMDSLCLDDFDQSVIQSPEVGPDVWVHTGLETRPTEPDCAQLRKCGEGVSRMSAFGRD